MAWVWNLCSTIPFYTSDNADTTDVIDDTSSSSFGSYYFVKAGNKMQYHCRKIKATNQARALIYWLKDHAAIWAHPQNKLNLQLSSNHWWCLDGSNNIWNWSCWYQRQDNKRQSHSSTIIQARPILAPILQKHKMWHYAWTFSLYKDRLSCALRSSFTNCLSLTTNVQQLWTKKWHCPLRSMQGKVFVSLTYMQTWAL